MLEMGKLCSAVVANVLKSLSFAYIYTISLNVVDANDYCFILPSSSKVVVTLYRIIRMNTILVVFV